MGGVVVESLQVELAKARPSGAFDGGNQPDRSVARDRWLWSRNERVCRREDCVRMCDEEMHEARQKPTSATQLPSNTIMSSSVTTEAKNTGRHRRRRRVRCEGSDIGPPGVVGERCPICCEKIGSPSATVTQVGVGPRVSRCHSTVDPGKWGSWRQFFSLEQRPRVLFGNGTYTSVSFESVHVHGFG